MSKESNRLLASTHHEKISHVVAEEKEVISLLRKIK